MEMELTAKQIYDMLINKDNILELQGQIKFFLGDVGIIVKQKDVVGNMKVWKITRRMKDWPLNLQIKDHVVHKIRPAVWYSTGRSGYSVFNSLEHFISAVEETVYQNPKTRERAGVWKSHFLENYEKHYGIRLEIPRWHDISESYINKK